MRFLDVKPGMKVVDTCAGAGGKTLHIAALMENKGQIVAMDIYESKLKKLKIRAKGMVFIILISKYWTQPNLLKNFMKKRTEFL